jgi:hypothetical protein
MQNKFKLIIPSIAGIIFILLLFTLALSTPSTLLLDGDTGMHVRTGEYILNNLSVPEHDIFSATVPSRQYVAYEWLSQVCMALVHRVGGLTGIVVLFSFLIAFTYYLLFRILKKENGNIVITILVALLVIAASSVHWLARPHMFSILLFIIWYYILDLYQYKNKNYLYILPLIMIIWVNLHGAFILGFMLCGIYLLGNIIQMLWVNEPVQNIYKAKAKYIFFIMIFLLIASILNPNGVKGLLQPLTVISDKFLVNHISEYLSPDFHNSNCFPFQMLLLFMIVILFFSKREKNIIEIALVVLFTAMALYSIRNIPFCAIIIAPVLVRHDDSIIYENKPEKGLCVRDCLWLILPSLIVTGLAVNRNIRHQFDESIKPVYAVEFLKTQNLQGNMFNEYDFGTYIIYSAYPQYKVFIDGRAEMYGPERFKDYYRIQKVRPGWEKILEKYNVNFMIINNDSTLSKFLLADNNWKLIYSDAVSDIFIKNIAQNKPVIEKYSDVRHYEAKNINEKL